MSEDMPASEYGGCVLFQWSSDPYAPLPSYHYREPLSTTPCLIDSQPGQLHTFGGHGAIQPSPLAVALEYVSSAPSTVAENPSTKPNIQTVQG